MLCVLLGTADGWEKVGAETRPGNVVFCGNAAALQKVKSVKAKQAPSEKMFVLMVCSQVEGATSEWKG